jgi:DNA-binding XRE family transcriptional regulator
MVDPERMAAARKSAMLERIELAHLSQALDLIKIATAEGVEVSDTTDVQVLRKELADAGISIKRPGQRIGVSRDEIAKLETGGRKRPKITTMRKLIATLNYARKELGKPPLYIEDLQVPGEVLIPATREAIDAYQEASNEIHYATEDSVETGG